MRLLLLLIVVGVAAYFTVPERAAHEEAARAYLQGFEAGERAPGAGVSLETIAGYVKGMFAGRGRYENFYLFSKYSVDMPGAAYLECYGAFTIVRCNAVEPAA
jgi:hypothetical protein